MFPQHFFDFFLFFFHLIQKLIFLFFLSPFSSNCSRLLPHPITFSNVIMFKKIIIYENIFNMLQEFFLLYLAKNAFYFFLFQRLEILRSTLFASNLVFKNFSSQIVACFSISTIVSSFCSLYIFWSISLSFSFFWGRIENYFCIIHFNNTFLFN